MEPDFIDAELASVMRAKRLSLGISLKKLSAHLGVTMDELSAIEGGERDPGVQLLAAAAEEFGTGSFQLMQQAEQLQDRPPDIRARMLGRTVTTQKQLNLIERQHYLMVRQVAAILRQVHALKDCSVPDGQAGRLKALEVRIVLHAQRLNAALRRIKESRQSCEESERFVLNGRRDRLKVMFS